MATPVTITLDRTWISARFAGREPEVRNLAGSDDIADAVRSLTQEPDSREGCPGVAVLTDSLVQRRMLHDLPSVRGRVLRELVRAQQARFFRTQRGALLTDARELREASSLRWEAVAVEATWVEALATAMHENGIRLRRVTDGSGKFSLLPPSHVAAMRQKRIRELAITAAIAACAWVSVGAIHVAALRQLERNLEARKAQLAPPHRALEEVRQSMGRIDAMADRLAQSRDAHAAMVFRIASVLLAFPDSAYLTSLDAGSASLSLTGAALNVPLTLAAVQRTWPGVAFTSLPQTATVPRDAQRQWQRFLIQTGKEPGS